MADDILNLDAEAGRDIIDDDAEPALTVKNTNASGTGLRAWASNGGVALDVDSTTGIGVDVDTTTGTGVDVLSAGIASALKSSATAAVVLDLSKTVVGSPTVALAKVLSSTPSGALIEFGVVDKGVVSTASAGATLAYGVRVKIGNTYGWLPVYNDIA